MKIQIRKGVFETNISSTHALCLGKKTYTTQKQDAIKFGVLTNSNYWTAKQDVQYRADLLYAAMINSYDTIKTLVNLGKLAKMLTELEIKYSFNTNEDYLENDIPYADNNDWVDIVLDSPDNLINYLFNDNSKFITMDRDEVYRQGGWENIVNTNKCEIYSV